MDRKDFHLWSYWKRWNSSGALWGVGLAGVHPEAGHSLKRASKEELVVDEVWGEPEN